MEFKLNKLTLVLLSAPLIANASITHNGSEYNLLPSNLATNITDNQEHTIKMGFYRLRKGLKQPLPGKPRVK